ncbi:MAG: hypothetical protein JWL85_14, partial [Candidatus Saccharibacteria bacterium]|nr:hypothetical protein [Candidatus Saccharibacteria bacterium]
QTDHWAAEKITEAFVMEVMLKEAKKDPAQAAIMFDDKTADGFRQVAVLETQGRYGEAAILQGTIEAMAPAPVYCGAGSCGLEAVNLSSNEGKDALALGLKAAHKNELLRDSERPCPSCNKLKIHYDYHGNKACTGCSYRQINGKIERPAQKPKEVVFKKQEKVAA